MKRKGQKKVRGNHGYENLKLQEVRVETMGGMT